MRLYAAFLWRRFLADSISSRVGQRLSSELDDRIAATFSAYKALPPQASTSEILTPLAPPAVESKMTVVTDQNPWGANFYIPPIGLQTATEGPFMAHSTCAAADFFHSDFARLCADLGMSPVLHRKYWEWVFILHHAIRTGAVAPGSRALGFAVGTEPLPSAFARIGAKVTATDAPESIGIKQGWQLTGEHATKLEDLFRANVIDRTVFEERVTFAACDMTRIPVNFINYDFCWSSCSFEHLGSLKAGLDFVIETVEKTLVPGGVACHTTEFNMSSDVDTIKNGPTVLYRKQDILRLIDVLERRGHAVDPFSIAPTTHMLDHLVDTPPYRASAHLKLQLNGYVCTSIGLVVRRGH